MKTWQELALEYAVQGLKPFEVARKIESELGLANMYDKVYGHSVFSAYSLDISTENRSLLWKREEPKEMTLEEVEKALGYPIKIVNK